MTFVKVLSGSRPKLSLNCTSEQEGKIYHRKEKKRGRVEGFMAFLSFLGEEEDPELPPGVF